MARSVKIKIETELHLKHLRGFLVRKVTRFGNGAKVDCPKEFLGKTVYLVIIDGTQEN
jgi:putative transposon-encoded protein